MGDKFNYMRFSMMCIQDNCFVCNTLVNAFMRGLWPMSKRGRGGGQKHTKFVKQRNITKITEYYRITEYYNGTNKTKRKSPQRGLQRSMSKRGKKHTNKQTNKSKEQTNKQTKGTQKQTNIAMRKRISPQRGLQRPMSKRGREQEAMLTCHNLGSDEIRESFRF